MRQSSSLNFAVHAVRRVVPQHRDRYYNVTAPYVFADMLFCACVRVCACVCVKITYSV